MERGRKMTENSYKTPCGCIHYFVNIMDKQRITLVFLPGLTADHRLFEKQIEYFENKQNVFVWDAPLSVSLWVDIWPKCIWYYIRIR